MAPSPDVAGKWIIEQQVRELKPISTRESMEADAQRRKAGYVRQVAIEFAGELGQDLVTLEQRARGAGLIAAGTRIEWAGFAADSELIGDSEQTRVAIINPVVRIRRNSREGNGELYLVIGQGESRVAQELVGATQDQGGSTSRGYETFAISGLVSYLNVTPRVWLEHFYNSENPPNQNYITILAEGEGIVLGEAGGEEFLTKLMDFLGNDETGGIKEALKLDDPGILTRAGRQGEKWLGALRRGGMATE